MRFIFIDDEIKQRHDSTMIAVYLRPLGEYMRV